MGLLGLIFFYIGISMGWLYVSVFCSSPRGFDSFSPVDVHGGYLGKCSRADRAGNHVEEGKQVGVHRGCYRRVYCGYRRLVSDHSNPQRQCYQCYGELRCPTGDSSAETRS